MLARVQGTLARFDYSGKLGLTVQRNLMSPCESQGTGYRPSAVVVLYPGRPWLYGRSGPARPGRARILLDSGSTFPDELLPLGQYPVNYGGDVAVELAGNGRDLLYRLVAVNRAQCGL